MTTVQPDNKHGALAGLPKIELHRHLEGSLRIGTLSEIARDQRLNLDLPGWEPDILRPHVQVMDDAPDFLHFLGKFRVLRQFYTNQETIERLAYEAVADAAADNIVYLELRFNPVALSQYQGFSYEEVIEWVSSGVEQSQQDHDIIANLIVQIGRDENQAEARRLAETAAKFQEHGVVAIDLAGDESNYPAAAFADVFQWGKAQGLHVTIHAGEAGPASNIYEAIEFLGAERIGHGVRAAEDQSVMDLLARNRIPLEMCPTSNLKTGVVSSWQQHPIWVYQTKGIPTTINTDDPSIFNVTLTDEYEVVLKKIGAPISALRQMILTAAESAFLPEFEKQALVEQLQQDLPNPLLP